MKAKDIKPSIESEKRKLDEMEMSLDALTRIHDSGSTNMSSYKDKLAMHTDAFHRISTQSTKRDEVIRKTVNSLYSKEKLCTGISFVAAVLWVLAGGVALYILGKESFSVLASLTITLTVFIFAVAFVQDKINHKIGSTLQYQNANSISFIAVQAKLGFLSTVIPNS